MIKRFLLSLAVLLTGCAGCVEPEEIRILTWAGIPVDQSDTLFAMAKACGIDMHMGFYATADQTLEVLDLAQKRGLMLIPSIKGMRDSADKIVPVVKDHPALYAYSVKDEPEVWDIPWLAELRDTLAVLDPSHPTYINLYPNWAWGQDTYNDNITAFADAVDVPFLSFDQYPVTQLEDGTIAVREGWYRNLEEFSALARRMGKPFWAFALSESHYLGPPSPPAFYPVPTLGHLRLQVFSDLLYGAQVIQYFTFRGMYDKTTLAPTPVFDIVRQVNSEIKAYSPIFAGAEIKGVWHTGDAVPDGTTALAQMPHTKVKSLEMSGSGAVVSLIEKSGTTYLAVQNRDCVNDAVLSVDFTESVTRITPEGTTDVSSQQIPVECGNMAIFKL